MDIELIENRNNKVVLSSEIERLECKLADCEQTFRKKDCEADLAKKALESDIVTLRDQIETNTERMRIQDEEAAAIKTALEAKIEAQGLSIENLEQKNAEIVLEAQNKQAVLVQQLADKVKLTEALKQSKSDSNAAHDDLVNQLIALEQSRTSANESFSAELLELNEKLRNA